MESVGLLLAEEGLENCAYSDEAYQKDCEILGLWEEEARKAYLKKVSGLAKKFSMTGSIEPIRQFYVVLREAKKDPICFLTEYSDTLVSLCPENMCDGEIKKDFELLFSNLMNIIEKISAMKVALYLQTYQDAVNQLPFASLKFLLDFQRYNYTAVDKYLDLFNDIFSETKIQNLSQHFLESIVVVYEETLRYNTNMSADEQVVKLKKNVGILQKAHQKFDVYDPIPQYFVDHDDEEGSLSFKYFQLKETSREMMWNARFIEDETTQKSKRLNKKIAWQYLHCIQAIERIQGELTSELHDWLLSEFQHEETMSSLNRLFHVYYYLDQHTCTIDKKQLADFTMFFSRGVFQRNLFQAYSKILEKAFFDVENPSALYLDAIVECMRHWLRPNSDKERLKNNIIKMAHFYRATGECLGSIPYLISKNDDLENTRSIAYYHLPSAIQTLLTCKKPFNNISSNISIIECLGSKFHDEFENILKLMQENGEKTTIKYINTKINEIYSQNGNHVDEESQLKLYKKHNKDKIVRVLSKFPKYNESKFKDLSQDKILNLFCQTLEDVASIHSDFFDMFHQFSKTIVDFQKAENKEIYLLGKAKDLEQTIGSCQLIQTKNWLTSYVGMQYFAIMFLYQEGIEKQTQDLKIIKLFKKKQDKNLQIKVEQSLLTCTVLFKDKLKECDSILIDEFNDWAREQGIS